MMYVREVSRLFLLLIGERLGTLKFLLVWTLLDKPSLHLAELSVFSNLKECLQAVCHLILNFH